MNYSPTSKFNHLNFLMGLNILIFLFFILLSGGFTGYESEFVEIFGALAKDYFNSGYWWTLITSAFLHVNFYHILLNVLALYQLGFIVDKFYSGKKLFIIYILGALASSLTTVFAFNANLLPDAPSLGASGAIYALLGLLIGGSLRKNRFGGSLPFELKAFVPTLFLTLLISLVPFVNLYAHLGGLVFGVVAGLILSNDLTPSSRQKDQRMVTFLYYLSIFILGASYFMLIFNLLFGN